MKVEELKAALSGYSKDQLAAIIVELYKSIPKAAKEDRAVDKLISNPKAFLEAGAKSRTKAKHVDVTLLKATIEEFVNNAEEGLYFAPNRIVNKSLRSKWRVQVKVWYQDLLIVAQSEENLLTASALIEKLYGILCYGCSFATFRTEDPFASLHISQSNFYAKVISLKFLAEPLSDFISGAIELLLNGHHSRETTTEDLIDVFVHAMATPDMKELSKEHCKRRLEQEQKRPKSSSKDRFSFSDEKYERERRVNDLSTLYFHLCTRLHEFDDGIEFYKSHYINDDKEITLFCLLRLLLQFRDKQIWLREYDLAEKAGIKPRDSLQKTARSIRNTGKMPEYFLQ